jgi:predicted alpha/beta-hydrolase family hydrolase
MNETRPAPQRRRTVRKWIRRAFLLWAITSTLWVANTFRTRSVDGALLRSDSKVSVLNGATTLEFLPATSTNQTGLIFICGSGVTAQAYASMLHPVAEAGFLVIIVKLPYRFAFLELHKQAAVHRVFNAIAAHPVISHWIVGGHSLGGALACRAAQADSARFSGLVLVGTTHPKKDDLSSLPLPVTKVYASNDGVAPKNRVLANQRLLPKATTWVEIKGGNHSQFGHYGHQLMDSKATVSREEQQAATRAALLDALTKAAN